MVVKLSIVEEFVLMVVATVVEISKMAVVGAAIVEDKVSLGTEVKGGKVCVNTIDTLMTAAKTPKIDREIIFFDVVCKNFNLVVGTFELSSYSLLVLFACRFCNHSDLSKSRGTFPVVLRS